MTSLASSSGSIPGIIEICVQVYISTDDPDGKCKGCLVQRKPCEEYKSPKPVGCPEDVRMYIPLHLVAILQ